MPHAPNDPSALSVHTAFVVHFRRNTDIAHDRIAGRVEHVVTGQRQQFASLEELLRFIAQILNDTH